MSEEENYEIEFYKVLQDSIMRAREYSWEMTKFYILLCSSLVSVTIGTLGIIQTSEHFANQDIVLKSIILLSLLLFPNMIIKIVTVGKSNFNRDSRRMYEYLATKIKFEQTHLIKEREPKGDMVFPCDKYNVPNRFINDLKCISSTKDFIDKYTSENEDNYYANTVIIYDIFKNVSYVLAAIIILVFINQCAHAIMNHMHL